VSKRATSEVGFWVTCIAAVLFAIAIGASFPWGYVIVAVVAAQRVCAHRQMHPLPSEFPSRQSRENLRAIREPEARNSEPYPNNGSRVWRHTESYNAFSPAVVGEAAGMFRFSAESSHHSLVGECRRSANNGRVAFPSQ